MPFDTIWCHLMPFDAIWCHSLILFWKCTWQMAFLLQYPSRFATRALPNFTVLLLLSSRICMANWKASAIFTWNKDNKAPLTKFGLWSKVTITWLVDVDDLFFSILQPFSHSHFPILSQISLGSSEPLFSRGSVCEAQNAWPVQAILQATSANKVRCWQMSFQMLTNVVSNVGKCVAFVRAGVEGPEVPSIWKSASREL